MDLPFLKKNAGKTCNQMVAVDLGNRTTKAVHLQRKNGNLVLCGLTALDSPAVNKALSATDLAEHLKTVMQEVGATTKYLALTVGANDVVVRIADTPMIRMDDFRPMLKINSKQYFQQELKDHVFDGQVILYFSQGEEGKSSQSGGKQAKQRVLMAASKQPLLDIYVQAVREAGLVARSVFPGLLGPINAFETAMPGEFMSGLIALVDIGYKHSFICILERGELVFTRVVHIGGNQLTERLCESMNISYAEAEGIKLGMASEVQGDLQSALTPLGRELRASLDCFEHQNEKTVSQVFLSGGSARCPVVRGALETELMMECKTWNPAANLEHELPPQQAVNFDEHAAQMAVAIGAALAAM